MDWKRSAILVGGALAVAVVTTVAANAVHAAEGTLRDNKYINDRLISAQIGDLIANGCPDISARELYALSQAWKLKGYANRQGFTDAEIKAFIGSETEKKRVKDAALAYMKAKGVVEGDAASYCTLGRDEIARKTITGSLLRAN